jgi:hypothetical protein
MKTILLMESPEALAGSLPVNITAVAILPKAQYQEFLENQCLPDRAAARMNAYTKSETKGTRITNYKAMLLLIEDSKHGIAVCGSGIISHAGHFPNAREWLDRRIEHLAGQVIRLSEIAKIGDNQALVSLPLDTLSKITGTLITDSNGIGELLVHELMERKEIAEIIMNEDCFEISCAPGYGQDEKQSSNMAEVAEDESSGIILR